jgi:hypothetical protein
LARRVPPEFIKLTDGKLAAIKSAYKKYSWNWDLTRNDDYLMSMIDF